MDPGGDSGGVGGVWWCQVVSSDVSLKCARLRPLNTQLALRSTTFLFRLSKQFRGGIEVVSSGVGWFKVVSGGVKWCQVV
jgi:hypothetical protein